MWSAFHWIFYEFFSTSKWSKDFFPMWGKKLIICGWAKSMPGWPDWANFRPLGNNLHSQFISFSKNIWSNFFHVRRHVLVLTKSGMGYILGHFFRKLVRSPWCRRRPRRPGLRREAWKWFASFRRLSRPLLPKAPSSKSETLFWSRVARWYIFKPNIPIWVNFGGPWNAKGWHIVWPYGIYYGSLVRFMGNLI
jgi:hypothetical protein